MIRRRGAFAALILGGWSVAGCVRTSSTPTDPPVLLSVEPRIAVQNHAFELVLTGERLVGGAPRARLGPPVPRCRDAGEGMMNTSMARPVTRHRGEVLLGGMTRQLLALAAAMLATQASAVEPQGDGSLPSFDHAPFVSPRVVQDLVPWLSDHGEQVVAVVAVDLAGSVGANRYSGNFEVVPTAGGNPKVVFTERADAGARAPFFPTKEPTTYTIESWTATKPAGSAGVGVRYAATPSIGVFADAHIEVVLTEEEAPASESETWSSSAARRP